MTSEQSLASSHAKGLGLEVLFRGHIIPSQTAYVDSLEDGEFEELGVDRRKLAVRSCHDQMYSDKFRTFVVTQRHELLYNRQVVWRTEISSHLDVDPYGMYTSTCELAETGHLRVSIQRKGGRWGSDKWTFRKEKMFDVPYIILGSATAHRWLNVDSENDQDYEILNQEEILDSEEFSSFIREVVLLRTASRGVDGYSIGSGAVSKAQQDDSDSFYNMLSFDDTSAATSARTYGDDSSSMMTNSYSRRHRVRGGRVRRSDSSIVSTVKPPIGRNIQGNRGTCSFGDVISLDMKYFCS